PGGPATGTTGGAGVATRSEEPGSDRFRSRDEDDEEPGRPQRCSRRVVDPQHPGKAVWDVGISIMIVYSVLVEPFRIGFGVEVSGAMLAIDIFVDCLFVIDIVLTFFTAYLDEREVLVTNRLRIAQRYLRGFFVIDVASVFPAELFLLAIQPDIATQARAVKLLRLVRLMKLGRLFKLKRLVLLVEEKLNFSLQVMDMLKMLVKVLFIVHWLACLTFLVASPVCADGTAMPCPPPEGPNDDTRFWSNWVRMFQVDKFDLAARYLSTFHFITATLMAVGYGDIFPANSFERIVCIVSQITGAVLFGFLLSCITAVLEFTHPRELEHKKRMSEIKNWLRNRSLPQPLKTQVWSHFCYVTAQRSAFKDEHAMLLSLPTHLRSQLVESSQKMYFQAIQASLGNFEKGLVAELAVQVMPMQVPYHMCILETGELTTELYVVVTGRVEAVLVEERHNENPEQLEAFLKLCLASSDPRRNGGGVAREDLFDEPSGNSLPDASADGEEARPRAERTRRRQATPTRGLIQRARSFLTEGVGFAAPAPSEDIIQILCGIYGELEAFGHCAVAPLRFRGGCYQSEIFSISQDILDRAMSAYPGRQQEFEVQCRSATKELARAMLSAEWSGQLPQCAQPTQRLKGLVVYRTKATDVRQLPADVLEEADEAGFAQEAVRCVSSKRLDKGGKVVTEVEPVQDPSCRHQAAHILRTSSGSELSDCLQQRIVEQPSADPAEAFGEEEEEEEEVEVQSGHGSGPTEAEEGTASTFLAAVKARLTQWGKVAEYHKFVLALSGCVDVKAALKILRGHDDLIAVFQRKFAPDADLSAVKAEIKEEDEPRPPPFPPARAKVELQAEPVVDSTGVKAEDDDTPRPPRFAPLERRPPPRVGDDSDEEHFDETAVATAASQGPRACVEELARLLFSRGRKAGDQTAQRVQMQRYAEKVSARPRFPRELYVLRGLPGIGKTEYAMERLLEMRPLDRGEEQSARLTHVCSVDDFLESFRGEPFKLEAAHRRNEARALLVMEAGIHPVFIDSSNLRLWEMRPYVLLAERLGYVVNVVEPWEICAKYRDLSFLAVMLDTAERRRRGRVLPRQALLALLKAFETLPDSEAVRRAPRRGARHDLLASR
ncbi:unnamed protein product, partial [Symbiodinium necroappetens]